MKKTLLSVALLSSTLFGGDLFLGVNNVGGAGTVSLTKNDESYTFRDTDEISTSGMKAYVGIGSIYAFYQSGTLTVDTMYMGNQDYTAFGLGYLKEGTPTKVMGINGRYLFDAYLGYDTMTSDGTGEFDKDKSGFLAGFTLGGGFSLASFDNVELTVGVGYELHAVKDDDTADNDDSTWNFGSIIYTTGLKVSF